jgi:hypothetical protein
MQNKKIISFGDSFVFGSELENNHDGCRSWIGQVANNLNVNYVTQAVPGCGNDHIAKQVYSWFSKNSAADSLAIINWTWMSRWDFYIVEHETWITLGPTCVPDKLKHLVEKTEAEDMIEFYQHRANSSMLWNKFRNLQTIYAVQSYLKHQNIANIQTYMDDHLFDTEWHAPDYVQQLQNLVRPEMQSFEGENFVDWSRSRGFAITDALHPLEDAHRAASRLWQDTYNKYLHA